MKPDFEGWIQSQGWSPVAGDQVSGKLRWRKEHSNSQVAEIDMEGIRHSRYENITQVHIKKITSAKDHIEFLNVSSIKGHSDIIIQQAYT